MDPSGKICVYTSVTAMGQGLETALSQLVADECGVEIGDVSVRCGDSTLSPYGSGSWASRGAVVGGGAGILAARRVREKVLAIAAHALEADAKDLEVSEGRIWVRGAPFRTLAVREVAAQAYMVSPKGLPDGVAPGLEATEYYDPPIQTISNGTHCAL